MKCTLSLYVEFIRCSGLQAIVGFSHSTVGVHLMVLLFVVVVGSRQGSVQLVRKSGLVHMRRNHYVPSPPKPLFSPCFALALLYFVDRSRYHIILVEIEQVQQTTL